ncbi:MAG: hypothetical protein HZA54_05295 [Planctomycetes bacterium]|nr:hypothetical protein [Planctomycetota bacterium]
MGFLDSLFGRAHDDAATLEEALRQVDFCRWFDAQCREYAPPEQVTKRVALEAEARKLLKRNGWDDPKVAAALASGGGTRAPAYARDDFEKYIGAWFLFRTRLETAYYEELKDLRLSTSQLQDVLRDEGWSEGDVRRFLMRFSPGGRAAAAAIAKLASPEPPPHA